MLQKLLQSADLKQLTSFVSPAFFDVMQIRPRLDLVPIFPTRALLRRFQFLAGFIAPAAFQKKRIPDFDLFFASSLAASKAPFQDLLIRSAL